MPGSPVTNTLCQTTNWKDATHAIFDFPICASRVKLEAQFEFNPVLRFAHCPPVCAMSGNRSKALTLHPRHALVEADFRSQGPKEGRDCRSWGGDDDGRAITSSSYHSLLSFNEIQIIQVDTQRSACTRRKEIFASEPTLFLIYGGKSKAPNLPPHLVHSAV